MTHHEHDENCECGCHGHHKHSEEHPHSHNDFHEEHHHIHSEKEIPEDGCTDGHFFLQAYSHENANVVSAQFGLQTQEPELYVTRLSSQMQHLSDWTQQQGGFVGHIKCGVSTEKSLMLSITDTELHQVAGTVQQMRINLAVILFGTDLEQQAEEVEKAIHTVFH